MDEKRALVFLRVGCPFRRLGGREICEWIWRHMGSCSLGVAPNWLANVRWKFAGMQNSFSLQIYSVILTSNVSLYLLVYAPSFPLITIPITCNRPGVDCCQYGNKVSEEADGSVVNDCCWLKINLN